MRDEPPDRTTKITAKMNSSNGSRGVGDIAELYTGHSPEAAMGAEAAFCGELVVPGDCLYTRTNLTATSFSNYTLHG